ncbi:MAG: hypothetical protein EOP84_16345 [Verrucomicrobiaceae bacterium]|nr:MAG: hypothetical protein EOP84_16345 [Verrucomicrobiaceae bacterium]
MTYQEYLYLSSEVTQLEALLAEISATNVINRMGLESRLNAARHALAGQNPQQLIKKVKLTFRGRPVFGSHGMAADFASKAAGFFTDAFSAVAAGLAENLRYMGPIPEKEKNQLLITGTASGSFGFDFELPPPKLALQEDRGETAMQKLERLFQVAAQGSDDDIAELVEEIHPRAVKKAADFLEYIGEQDAWCGVEFKEQVFRFAGVEQVRASVERLKSGNIKETDESFRGEFQGVLPKSRAFEFKLLDQDGVIRGKVGPEILDPAVLNRDFLHKPVTVEFHVIQVGQGRPRYTLLALEKIE